MRWSRDWFCFCGGGIVQIKPLLLNWIESTLRPRRENGQ